jgi:hypothetical protein
MRTFIPPHARTCHHGDRLRVCLRHGLGRTLGQSLGWRRRPQDIGPRGIHEGHEMHRHEVQETLSGVRQAVGAQPLSAEVRAARDDAT